jgi:hypothetical protein
MNCSDDDGGWGCMEGMKLERGRFQTQWGNWKNYLSLTNPDPLGRSTEPVMKIDKGSDPRNNYSPNC